MSIGVPRGQHALAVSAIFTSLATVFTLVRMYTRAFLVKQIGADDWTILISLAFSWAFFGLFVGETAYLMGEHFENIPKDTLTKQMICFWASVPIYQASLITTKASILLQYKRVFSTTNMRIVCYILIGFLGVWGTWTFISAWLNCVPVAKFWDDSLEGYCLDKKALWFSNSGIHIFTDILLLLFPMPVLKNLQLPRPQKLALIAVFALGIFVLITSILRLQSLLVISDSTDSTYDNVGAAQWSAIECNTAIICAVLPATRAFISKLLPQIFSTSKSKNTTNPYGPRSRSRTPGFQASVAAGGSADPHYTLSNLGGRQPDQKDVLSSSPPAEIKVTTKISQESVMTPDADDFSSMKGLIKD
ncbi:putative integral membrane protein [Aspergillus undulatus]|uniref:putative integral membrane protein n=1 Tax=Aspergillus undulatus TaxID=1810928 RepID=UPI003CCCD26E